MRMRVRMGMSLVLLCFRFYMYFVEIMKLLQQHRIHFFHAFQNKLQFIIVAAHKVVTSEASVSVYNKIVLLRIKDEIIFKLVF